MITRPSILLTAFAVLLLNAGCTDDPLFPAHTFTVKATLLPALGPNAYYELWLSYPSNVIDTTGTHGSATNLTFISAGKFRVDASGSITGVTGGAAAFLIPAGYNPALFDLAVVSVENPGTAGATPNALMLGGAFSESPIANTVQLTVSGSVTFRNAFDSILTKEGNLGSFVLDVPTTSNATDFTQGIWFTTPNFNTTSLPLLGLPVSTANKPWEYEAWLVHRSTATEYISLGRFINPIHADDNGPGPGAGSTITGAYNVPGEDFAAAGMERTLTDGSYGVVVSLQPLGIALDKPLIRLFVRDTIPIEATRLESVSLRTVTAQPTMEVTIAK